MINTGEDILAKWTIEKKHFSPYPILTLVSSWSVWNFKDYVYSFIDRKQKDQLLKKHGHHCVKYKFFYVETIVWMY